MSLDPIPCRPPRLPAQAPDSHARREAALAALVPPFVHKLNNLLGAALGFSDMLMARYDNPRAPELLSGINEGTDDAVGLLRLLAEFAKPALEEPESVEAAELLRSVASLVQPLAESRRARIEIAVELEAATLRVPRRAIVQRLAVGLVESFLALPDAERDPSRRTARLTVRPAPGGRVDVVLAVPSSVGLVPAGRAESDDLHALEARSGLAREMRVAGGLVRASRLRLDPVPGSLRTMSAQPPAALPADGADAVRGAAPSHSGGAQPGAAQAEGPTTEQSPAAAPPREAAGSHERARDTARVLLFERDGPLGELIADVLAETGYRVERLDGELACRNRMSEQPPDLLLIDRPLEARDGLEMEALATSAKDAGARVGVLGPEFPGLRIAALAKPFRPGELIEFVAALLD